MRSFPSSLGKALSNKRLPDRSKATAWCTPFPTSTPIKTAIPSSWLSALSASRHLIAHTAMTLAESLGIHVTGGLQAPRAEPLSAMTDCLSNPVTTPPGSGSTGGSNHAGPDWPYLYGRGGKIVTGMSCIPRAGAQLKPRFPCAVRRHNYFQLAAKFARKGHLIEQSGGGKGVGPLV